jgi:hypothetical protein
MDIKKVKDIPFFYIMGVPRSGTSLLRTLFDAHPNVVIPMECMVIKDLYGKYKNITHWDSNKISKLYKDLSGLYQIDNWTIDKEKVKTDLLRCEGANSFQDLIKVVYLNYVSFFRKSDILYIGDKNPSYASSPEYMMKIFPDAKIIHIIRDYRDNLISYREVGFGPPFDASIVYEWKRSYTKMMKLKQQLPESQIKTIRYEDIAFNPEQSMQDLCAFLSIPYHPEVFKFYEKKDQAYQNYPPEKIKRFERWHKNLIKPIHTYRINMWKEKMSAHTNRLADVVAGECAEQAGYEKKYKKHNIQTGIFAFMGIFYKNIWYFAQTIFFVLPPAVRVFIKQKIKYLKFV